MTTSNTRRPLLRSATAILLAAGLCTAAALPARVVHAQGDEDDIATKVEELSQRGVELYSKGKYNEAIAVFEQAYRLAPVSNLLYNIALSWEKLDKPENAVESYERFIVADDANPAVRAKALKRIKELNELLEARRNSGPSDTGDKGSDTVGNTTDGPGNNNTGPEGPDTPAEPDDGGGMGGLGVAGLVTGGVGLLAIGGGVFFGLAASDDVGEFDDARTIDDKDTARSDAESNALLADILYGVGGAAVVAGLVMVVMDLGGGETDAQPGEATSLKLIPMFTPEAAGAAMHLNF